MDEYNYDRLAFSLTTGGNFFPGGIYSQPGYPSFVCLVYLIAGRNLDLIWFLQAGMGALSCGLTFLLGQKIFGRRAGWLSGLILALYGPALFYETRLLPSAAALLVSLLALAWWLYLPGSRRILVWFAGGILLGLAGVFAGANLLFAGSLIFLWIPWKGRRPPPLYWKEAGVILGLLIILVPFLVRNARHAGSPVALTAHAGINFYIGNNPEANGGFLIPRYLTPSATGIIRDAHRTAEARLGRTLTPGDASRFWLKEGLRFLATSPGAGGRLWTKKISLLISPLEYCDVGGSRVDKARPFSLYGIPLISFGLIAPFALAGIFLSARRKRSMVLLYLYLGSQCLAILLYYYQARARLLIVPVCAIFAAGSIRYFYQALRERQIKRVLFAILLLIAALLITRAQPLFEMRSETNLLLARAQDEVARGNFSDAREKVQRALDIYPGLGGARLVLGDIARRLGKEGSAEDYYREEEKRAPLNPEPYLRLSDLFNARGEPEMAEEEARRALAIDPISWEAHSLLADSYYYRGDAERELRYSRMAVFLNPNSVKDHNNLGVHYARKGDPGMAEYHWKRVERMNIERQ